MPEKTTTEPVEFCTRRLVEINAESANKMCGAYSQLENAHGRVARRVNRATARKKKREKIRRVRGQYVRRDYVQ